MLVSKRGASRHGRGLGRSQGPPRRGQGEAWSHCRFSVDGGRAGGRQCRGRPTWIGRRRVAASGGQGRSGGGSPSVGSGGRRESRWRCGANEQANRGGGEVGDSGCGGQEPKRQGRETYLKFIYMDLGLGPHVNY
jgi:hypothetical protein